MAIYINLVYEDLLSEAVMTQLLKYFGAKYEIANSYNGNGFGYLKTNIKGFNEAAKGVPFFMLTDLDNYKCPVALKNDWINFDLNKNFIFRIAIKEVEAWLLADIENLSKYFNISEANFSIYPDEIQDPKIELINLAKRSRLRVIREDVVPINQNASIGPNYNGALTKFIYQYWSIENAAKRSQSLNRAVKNLNEFSY